MEIKSGLHIIPFQSQKTFAQWLADNYTSSKGFWLKIAKKASGIQTVTYDEALEVALCYGWIDGQINKYDNQYYLQKFTPRSPKSIWSKRNREIVTRLISDGSMQPAGLEKIDAAKKDGRWDMAYDSPKNMVIPDDFLKDLAKNKKAEDFFKTLNKTNLYSIGWRLQTAKKQETREKRKLAIITMLAKGEKFY